METAAKANNSLVEPKECILCHRPAESIEPVYLLCDCQIYCCIDCVRLHISKQPSLWSDGFKCPCCKVSINVSVAEGDAANEQLAVSIKELLEYCKSEEMYPLSENACEEEVLTFIVNILDKDSRMSIYLPRVRGPSLAAASNRLLLARINSFRKLGCDFISPRASSANSAELFTFYSLPLGPLSTITIPSGKLSEVDDRCPVCDYSFCFGYISTVATQCACLCSSCSNCARNMIGLLEYTFYALETGYRCTLCRGSMATWGNIRAAVDLENRLLESSWNFCGYAQRVNYFIYSYKHLNTYEDYMHKMFDKYRTEGIALKQFGIGPADFKKFSVETKRLMLARFELRRILIEWDKLPEDEDADCHIPFGPLHLLTFPRRLCFDVALKKSSRHYMSGQLMKTSDIVSSMATQQKMGEGQEQILRSLRAAGFIQPPNNANVTKYSILVPGLGCLCPICDLTACHPSVPGKNPLIMSFKEFRKHMFDCHKEYKVDPSLCTNLDIHQCEFCNKLTTSTKCDSCADVRLQEKISSQLREMGPFTHYCDAKERVFVADHFSLSNMKQLFVELDKLKASQGGILTGDLVPVDPSFAPKPMCIQFDKWVINGRHYSSRKQSSIFQGVLLIVNPTKDFPVTTYYKLLNPTAAYTGLASKLFEFRDSFIQFTKFSESVILDTEQPLRLVPIKLNFQIMIQYLPQALIPYLLGSIGLKRFREFIDFMVSRDCVFYETFSATKQKIVAAQLQEMWAAADDSRAGEAPMSEEGGTYDEDEDDDETGPSPSSSSSSTPSAALASVPTQIVPSTSNASHASGFSTSNAAYAASESAPRVQHHVHGHESDGRDARDTLYSSYVNEPPRSVPTAPSTSQVPLPSLTSTAVTATSSQPFDQSSAALATAQTVDKNHPALPSDSLRAVCVPTLNVGTEPAAVQSSSSAIAPKKRMDPRLVAAAARQGSLAAMKISGSTESLQESHSAGMLPDTPKSQMALTAHEADSDGRNHSDKVKTELSSQAPTQQQPQQQPHQRKSQSTIKLLSSNTLTEEQRAQLLQNIKRIPVNYIPTIPRDHASASATLQSYQNAALNNNYVPNQVRQQLQQMANISVQQGMPKAMPGNSYQTDIEEEGYEDEQTRINTNRNRNISVDIGGQTQQQLPPRPLPQQPLQQQPQPPYPPYPPYPQQPRQLQYQYQQQQHLLWQQQQQQQSPQPQHSNLLQRSQPEQLVLYQPLQHAQVQQQQQLLAFISKEHEPKNIIDLEHDDSEDSSTESSDDEAMRSALSQSSTNTTVLSEYEQIQNLIVEAEQLYPEIPIADILTSGRRAYEASVTNADLLHKKFLQHCKFHRFKNFTMWFEVRDILQSEQQIVVEHKGEISITIRIYYCDDKAKYRSCYLSLPRIKNKLNALRSLLHFRFGVDLSRNVVYKNTNNYRLQEGRSFAYYNIVSGGVVHLLPTNFGPPTQLSNDHLSTSVNRHIMAREAMKRAATMTRAARLAWNNPDGVESDMLPQFLLVPTHDKWGEGEKKAAMAGVLGSFCTKTVSLGPRVWRKRKSAIQSDEDEDEEDDNIADGAFVVGPTTVKPSAQTATSTDDNSPERAAHATNRHKGEQNSSHGRTKAKKYRDRPSDSDSDSSRNDEMEDEDWELLRKLSGRGPSLDRPKPAPSTHSAPPSNSFENVVIKTEMQRAGTDNIGARSEGNHEERRSKHHHDRGDGRRSNSRPRDERDRSHSRSHSRHRDHSTPRSTSIDRNRERDHLRRSQDRHHRGPLTAMDDTGDGFVKIKIEPDEYSNVPNSFVDRYHKQQQSRSSSSSSSSFSGSRSAQTFSRYHEGMNTSSQSSSSPSRHSSSSAQPVRDTGSNKKKSRKSRISSDDDEDGDDSDGDCIVCG